MFVICVRIKKLIVIVWSVVTSQNCNGQSKLSSIKPCIKWLLYGWNLYFCNIRWTLVRFPPFATLQSLSTQRIVKCFLFSTEPVCGSFSNNSRTILSMLIIVSPYWWLCFVSTLCILKMKLVISTLSEIVYTMIYVTKIST